MKELFVNNIGKRLIEDKGFLLINTPNIPMTISKYSFMKDKWGTLHFVNFVDADIIDFSSDILSDVIDRELSMFKQVSNMSALICFKVFVSQDPLSDIIISKILELYRHSIVEKTSFIPIILSLSSGTPIIASEKLDKLGIMKLFKKTLEQKEYSQSFYNLEEIEGKLRNKNEYTNYKGNETMSKLNITYLLIAINIIAFIITSAAGGIQDTDIILKFGAKINYLIARGEYWRLLSSAFLHLGVAHIIFNMYGLYNIGLLVEKIYGSKKFLFIYLFAALSGSTCSFVFSSVPSAGASGAIFGLFGALLYLGQNKPKMFTTSFGVNILIVLGFNIIYGLSNTGIDNFAHIGGLIGGYLAANIVGLKRIEYSFKKLIILILSILLLLSGIYYGVKSSASSLQYYYTSAQDSYDSGNYIECRDILKKAVLIDQNIPQVHALMSLAYYNIGNEVDGENEFNKAVNLEKFQPSLFFNLGNFFINNKEYLQAEAMFKRYIEIQPEQYEGFMNLGVAFNIEGKLDDAEENFKKAIVLAPNEFLPNINITYLYISRKDYDNAKKYLEKAAAINPEDKNVITVTQYLEKQGY